MATDFGLEILVDSSVSDDDKSNILRRVLQALAQDTLAVAYATTYSAGSSSTNEVSLEVGGTSEDYGIRIVLDESAYGTNDLPKLIRRILQALTPYAVVFIGAASYTAGDRTYNVTITVT